MKPILFNTDMVRAILDGRKTVTRRVVKEPYYIDNEESSRVSGLAIHRGTNMTDGMPYPDSPCRSGDILYVRETFCPFGADHVINGVKYAYKADATPESEGIRKAYGYKWRPSIHMPREAARIFLRVTDVRVERLREITIEGMRMEGVIRHGLPGGCACAWKTETCMREPCPNRDAYEYECWALSFTKVWNSTIKKADRALYSWGANPWVWVIEFERISREGAESHGH